MSVQKGRSSAAFEDVGALIEIYTLLIEMADKVSERRQAANNFYLSINTALIGGSAVLSAAGPGRASWLLGVAGIAICLLWMRSIASYRTLNAAKFEVIHKLETRLPAQAYTEEWGQLDPAGSGLRHRAFHATEGLVPLVFIGIHAAQVGFNIPWHWLLNRI